MPAEPAGLARIDVRSHGPRPVGPAYAGKPAHHGVHDVREPVSALQCITAVARGARHLGQLAASLAMYGWQVVRVARHLAGLAQASCNFRFLPSSCIHVIILSNKIPYRQPLSSFLFGVHKSSGLLLVEAWRLRAWCLPLAAGLGSLFRCSQ